MPRSPAVRVGFSFSFSFIAPDRNTDPGTEYLGMTIPGLENGEITEPFPMKSSSREPPHFGFHDRPWPLAALPSEIMIITVEQVKQQGKRKKEYSLQRNPAPPPCHCNQRSHRLPGGPGGSFEKVDRFPTDCLADYSVDGESRSS